MKKTALLLIIFFSGLSANAQVGVLGDVIKAKREAADKKKREEAIRKKDEELRIQDSIRIEKAKKQNRYYDSVAAVNKAEQKRNDSIQKMLIKKRDDSIYLAIEKEASKKVWEKLNMDSVTFKEVYGSEYEYRLQQGQMQQSKNGWRVFLIGAKSTYLNYMLIYLSNNKGWSVSEPKIAGSSYSGYAEMYNNKFAYDAKIYIKATLDAKSRIKNVTITGTANDVIDLFLDYWEDYDISVSSLKNKKSVYIMRGSDKITFTWTGANPVISISKGVVDFGF